MSCDDCADPRSFPYTAGDTLPNIAIKYQNPDGTPINITGYAFILQVQRPSPFSLLNKNGVITDAVNGLVLFSFVAGDLVAGIQPADVKVVYPSGDIQTFQQLVLNVKAAAS